MTDTTDTTALGFKLQNGAPIATSLSYGLDYAVGSAYAHGYTVGQHGVPFSPTLFSAYPDEVHAAYKAGHAYAFQYSHIPPVETPST